MSDIHKVERSTSDLGTRPHQVGVQGWLLLKVVSTQSDGDERLSPRVYETDEAALAKDALPNAVLRATAGRTPLKLTARDGTSVTVLVDLVAPFEEPGGGKFDPLDKFDSTRALIPPHHGTTRP